MDTPVYIRFLLLYLEFDLGDGLPELFALNLSNFELKLSWQARAVSTSEGTGTPRRS